MENTNINIEILKELENIHMPDNDQSVSLLNQFLDNLSTNNRKVFIKRYYCYNDIKDIAAAMSISENTVKNILLRTCGELEVYIYSSGLTANVDDDATNYQNVMNVIKKVNNEFIKEATSGADIEVNDEAETVNDNAPKKKLSLKQKVYIGVAALVSVVVLIIVGMSVPQVKNKNNDKNVLPKLDVPYQEGVGKVDDSIDENDLSYQLPTITYNGNKYIAIHSYVYNGNLRDLLEIQSVYLSTTPTYEQLEIEEVEYLLNIYSTALNATDNFIVVKFSDTSSLQQPDAENKENVENSENSDDITDYLEEKFYVYFKSDYVPATFQAALDDLSIRLNQIGDGIYFYRNKGNKNQQIIYSEDNLIGAYIEDILFKDKTIPSLNCSDKDFDGNYIICIKYNGFGFNGKPCTFYVKTDGTTLIDYYGSKYKFKTDVALIQEFFDKLPDYADLYEVDYFPEF